MKRLPGRNKLITVRNRGVHCHRQWGGESAARGDRGYAVSRSCTIASSDSLHLSQELGEAAEGVGGEEIVLMVLSFKKQSKQNWFSWIRVENGKSPWLSYFSKGKTSISGLLRASIAES